MLPRCASLSFSYLAYVAHEIRLQAVANGDLSKQIEVDAQGEILDLKNTVNGMVIRLRALAAEVRLFSLSPPLLSSHPSLVSTCYPAFH